MSGIIGGAGSKSGVIGTTELDYEQGESDASITCGGGSITLQSTHNKIHYTKIGRLVCFVYHLRVASVSSPSGSLVINGLPFTVGASEQFRGAIAINPAYNVASPANSSAIGQIGNNGTTFQINFYQGGTGTLTAASYYQNNSETYITGSYQTND